MVAFGDAVATPPELNWYQLSAGDHAASLVAAAAGHQSMAAMIGGEAGSLGGNAAATATGWEGAGGAAMTVNATEQVGVMGMALGWLTQGAASLASAGQTYQTAYDSMIPGPVCDTNRATQAGLVASNILGQNTPAIVALDTEYFGHMWTVNAAAMSMWQSAAAAVIGELTIPPPFNPVVANPAGPAAALAGSAAQTGATAGMQGATQPMEAAGGSSMMSQVTPLLGQFGSMAGQLPQMAGQLPQMASQFPQLLTGMLGGNMLNPAASGLTATDALPAVGAVGAGGSLGAASSATAGSGLGGGVGGVGALPGITSSYTRPATAFTPPATPKMPTGWDVAPTPAPGSAAPMGGMYGAAPASALGANQAEGEKPAARPVKVAPRNGR